MRTINYTQLPPIGSDDELYEANLLEFILDIPNLITFGLIPPLTILNEIFKKGIEDAGMSGGCEWEPFEIDQTEYNELIKSLMDMSGGNFRVVSPPTWVKNKDDWHIWCQEYEMDIPHEQFYQLSLEDKKWDKLKRQAEENGNEDLAMEYHLKGLETGERLMEFITPYIAKYHKRMGKLFHKKTPLLKYNIIGLSKRIKVDKAGLNEMKIIREDYSNFAKESEEEMSHFNFDHEAEQWLEEDKLNQRHIFIGKILNKIRDLHELAKAGKIYKKDYKDLKQELFELLVRLFDINYFDNAGSITYEISYAVSSLEKMEIIPKNSNQEFFLLTPLGQRTQVESMAGGISRKKVHKKSLSKPIFDFNIVGLNNEIKVDRNKLIKMENIFHSLNEFINLIDLKTKEYTHKYLYGNLTEEEANKILSNYKTVYEGMKHIPGRPSKKKILKQDKEIVDEIISKLIELKKYGELEIIYKEDYRRNKEILLKLLFKQFGSADDMDNLNYAVKILEEHMILPPNSTDDVIQHSPVGRWY